MKFKAQICLTLSLDFNHYSMQPTTGIRTAYRQGLQACTISELLPWPDSPENLSRYLGGWVKAEVKGNSGTVVRAACPPLGYKPIRHDYTGLFQCEML